MNIIYKAIRVLKHTLYFVFYTKHKILSYDNIYFVFLYIIMNGEADCLI